jgi:hypothetical protein
MLPGTRAGKENKKPSKQAASIVVPPKPEPMALTMLEDFKTGAGWFAPVQDFGVSLYQMCVVRHRRLNQMGYTGQTFILDGLTKQRALRLYTMMLDAPMGQNPVFQRQWAPPTVYWLEWDGVLLTEWCVVNGKLHFVTRTHLMQDGDRWWHEKWEKWFRKAMYI